MNRGVIVTGVVVALGVAVIGYQMGASGSGTALLPVEMEGLDDPAILVEIAEPAVLGDPDAPVSIIEFGDYQCPACQSFNAQVKPQVDLRYIQTGQANLVYYDFPIVAGHPHAFIAARAARCAGDQGEYWGYHDALFANQPRWSASGGAPLGDFEDYAAELGLDASAFSSCLRSDRHAEVVTANLALGRNLGVSATPSIMISDGSGRAHPVGGNSFGAIEEVMNQVLGGAAAGAGGEAGSSGDGGGA